MKKGFTLVELLATIIILGVIAAIIIPNYKKITENSKNKTNSLAIESIVKEVKKSKLENEVYGSIEAIIDNNELYYYVNGVKTVIKYNGKLPDSGTIAVYGDGTYAATVKYGDKYYTKSDNPPSPNAQLINDLRANNKIIEDSYELGRYIYKGNVDNNYIYIDENGANVLYRIIAFEKDGTIKVVRNEAIDYMSWDTGGLRAEKDNTYCECNGELYSENICDESDNCYTLMRGCSSINKSSGCNAWGNMKNTYQDGKLLNDHFSFKHYIGSTQEIPTEGKDFANNNATVVEDSSLNQYLNNTFLINKLSNVTSYIDEHMWDVGFATEQDDLKKAIDETKVNTWKGKIGLFSIIDYVKASDNTDCKNISNMQDRSSYYYYCSQNSDGIINNYLFKNSNEWTITADNMEVNSVWYVLVYDLYPISYTTNSKFLVSPAFYLKSTVKINGDGTINNPYKIAN